MRSGAILFHSIKRICWHISIIKWRRKTLADYGFKGGGATFVVIYRFIRLWAELQTLFKVPKREFRNGLHHIFPRPYSFFWNLLRRL